MKKRLLILSGLLLTLLIGCEKSWDNHFGYEEDERCAAASMNIMETLKAMPKRYSKFVDMVERSGYDLALGSDRMLTVWAPSNDLISDENFNLEGPDLKRFVKNHMNSLPLFKTKLSGRSAVTTLAGKVLSLRYRNNNYYLNDIQVKSYDIACKNGVIHEMTNILKPLKNLAEYLDESGEEYSIFRDTLYRRNDTIFRPDLSFPIGVDNVGQTIYDSVFDIKNTLLKGLDLNDEAAVYTLCLPSNTVIEEALKVMQEYMEGIKRPITTEDTVVCMQWMMKASVLSGKRVDYTSVKKFYSLFGAEIRPTKQIVQTEYKECSNGIVYDFESLYFPRSLFMTNIETWPLYFAQMEKEALDTFLITNATKFVEFSDKGSPFLRVGGNTGTYIEFNPIARDKYANPVKIKLLPGTYEVYGQWYGYNTSSTKIQINGEVQRYHKNKSEVFPTGSLSDFEYTTYPKMIDTLVIPVHMGYHSPSIRIESTSSSDFAVKRLRFSAVGDDNY
ncbi:MAG: fasciclin domain-containing protein [Marinifilaceae bacterium]